MLIVFKTVQLLDLRIARLQRISFLTKNWRNDEKLAVVTENIDFWRNLTKLASFGICGKIFDERKIAFLVAKSGRDLEKALSHKFNHVTF